MFSPSRLSRTLIATIWLLQPVTAPLQAAGFELPEMGDSAGVHLPAGKEKRLGQVFMRSVRANTTVESDPLLTEYLQDLGAKLAKKSGSGGNSFDFFLVREPTINAFAGPGGHIGIHPGLVLETQTDSELAAVVAHEIAHVNQRHIARMLEAAENMSLPAAGLLLAAILLGVAGGGSAALAAAAGGQAALVQQQINFTRSNEKEADRVGMQILADADFDPRAMPVFFQRMSRADRTSGIALPEFLRTHPVSTSRIADSLARAESFPYRQNPEDIRYHLTRAALRAAQFASPAAAEAHFKSTLRDGRYRDRNAEGYGYALALMRTGKHAEARREIDRLLAASPNQLEYSVASARLYKKTGDARRALGVLKGALAKNPGSHALAVIAAETMLSVGDGRGAYDLLRRELRKRPYDPELHRLQARAAAASGRQAESHLHLAEYHYGVGELDAAVRQLEIAARQGKAGFHEKSRIEARLNQVKTELEVIRRDKRGGNNR